MNSWTCWVKWLSLQNTTDKINIKAFFLKDPYCSQYILLVILSDDLLFHSISNAFRLIALRRTVKVKNWADRKKIPLHLSSSWLFSDLVTFNTFLIKTYWEAPCVAALKQPICFHNLIQTMALAQHTTANPPPAESSDSLLSELIGAARVLTWTFYQQEMLQCPFPVRAAWKIRSCGVMWQGDVNSSQKWVEIRA